MNGIDYIADTNAIIYLLSGNLCMKPYISKRLGISIISEMEILSFSGMTDADEKCIMSFVNDCIVLELSEKIKNHAIMLRRICKIKLPDAIAAATAIEYSLPLITADKNFRQIPGIDLILIEPILS
ncbi:type II toxin-antitoxin system VapC family toxin [Treponema putidum]|uniref:PIN domain-containing protein n=1 Tax=Treponema putidum TaxID=221027 RepID=A0AAE9SHK7_9SPIR|nr:type II toxin-antitoxin system VapC family toxin [Treponema putidum]UTY33165.1 PIN domain-containing protein [Treponema putidum]